MTDSNVSNHGRIDDMISAVRERVAVLETSILSLKDRVSQSETGQQVKLTDIAIQVQGLSKILASFETDKTARGAQFRLFNKAMVIIFGGGGIVGVIELLRWLFGGNPK